MDAERFIERLTQTLEQRAPRMRDGRELEYRIRVQTGDIPLIICNTVPQRAYISNHKKLYLPRRKVKYNATDNDLRFVEILISSEDKLNLHMRNILPCTEDKFRDCLESIEAYLLGRPSNSFEASENLKQCLTGISLLTRHAPPDYRHRMALYTKMIHESIETLQ